MESFDVVVIGAGAAGMMCAIEAGKRGRRVLLTDHAATPGEKIRISGGGRCNFTNIGTTPKQFLSANPHFCISALSRYTPADFIALVKRHRIAFHEKTVGQLFCDDSAKQIVAMLVAELGDAGVKMRLGVETAEIQKVGDGFALTIGERPVTCDALVIATGGKSIPKMGATGFGYEVARRFGLGLIETRPALVPLTFETSLLERLAPLSGVSVNARVSHRKSTFEEGLLFTHRGLSGPSGLQISAYWREGDAIRVDLAPGVDVLGVLRAAKTNSGKKRLDTVLTTAGLPRRLADVLVSQEDDMLHIADAPDALLQRLASAANAWTVKPVGSEGYRTAEVTLGGVDTRDLDQKSMAARRVPGLYFIGEVVDVTGWLGGYNFQWAWASGWCAGQFA